MNWDKWVVLGITAVGVTCIISMTTGMMLSDYYGYQEKMIKLQKCRGL
jgi:hypothetical protein